MKVHTYEYADGMLRATSSWREGDAGSWHWDLWDGMDLSRSEDMIVSLTVPFGIQVVRASLKKIYDGYIDSFGHLDGSYDVWGWKDTYPEVETEWLLHITVNQKGE